ncbi:basic proline-rich protein-like [Sorghum bicolor]|uniref:basic proline-rich protein-like n=1 Tax=Sorghum bicolor TaxID=4558 RepID=UPI000B424D8B|nr:basic proline-rich protein-like [Sorghum bicolor]|eukprot:XP_021311805.1 basic proline-rich protein-like [Sorghum bicolor]
MEGVLFLTDRSNTLHSAFTIQTSRPKSKPSFLGRRRRHPTRAPARPHGRPPPPRAPPGRAHARPPSAPPAARPPFSLDRRRRPRPRAPPAARPPPSAARSPALARSPARAHARPPPRSPRAAGTPDLAAHSPAPARAPGRAPACGFARRRALLPRPLAHCRASPPTAYPRTEEKEVGEGEVAPCCDVVSTIARFLEPPDVGEVLSKFSIDTYCLFMQEKSTSQETRRTPFVFVRVAVLPALRRLTTASTRTAPDVYRENDEEVLPKFCLG